MTDRLYTLDSKLLEFDATIVRVDQAGENSAVVLDRSAFYPTGGGQPFDQGTLNEHRVTDVQASDDGGEVLHILDGPVDWQPGIAVRGCVDGNRRRDHRQQHSGQHILTQAFSETSGRETTSFHMGQSTSTIDLDGLVDRGAMDAAERRANEIVFEDRAVHTHVVTPDELPRFPSLRQSFTGSSIRVIEVDGFDQSTCGGTHVQRTGEIGLIAVLGAERIKKTSRVEFVCGTRALDALHQAHDVSQQAARALTTSPDSVVQQLRRLQESLKSQQKRIKQLFGEVSDKLAADLRSEARSHGEGLAVVRVLEGLNRDEAQLLAAKLCQEPGLIALLGVQDGLEARLLFQRHAKLVSPAMGELMKRVLTRLEGRGGGSPTAAQGILANHEQLNAALETAFQELSS